MTRLSSTPTVFFQLLLTSQTPALLGEVARPLTLTPTSPLAIGAPSISFHWRGRHQQVTSLSATLPSPAMSKVDFEYYPHSADVIWDFMPDCSVLVTGQVCWSWRYRASKRLYHHLGATPTYQGWFLTTPSQLSKDVCHWYSLPYDDSEIQYFLVRPQVTNSCPRLDVALAARATETKIWCGMSTISYIQDSHSSFSRSIPASGL